LSEKEKIGRLERISLSIGHTQQTGPFEFTKTFTKISRDVALGENPFDGLRGLESLLEHFMKERGQKVAKSESKEPQKPTETPELYASVLESLQWTPGARAGREWVIMSRNEEKLRPVLNLMRQIDPNGYHTVAKWKYRVEGDFLARYGSTKPKQTQFPGANDQERKI
jgi:hypothetical protein